MGACSEDPHLCGASWLLRFTSLLLSVCSAVTQSPGARGSAVDDSGNPVPLKGTLGASVLFHMIKNPYLPPGAKLESITWGIINQKMYTPVLQVSPGLDGPRWLNCQEKFKKRVHVVNTTTLRIDNLTLEDSGLYRAQESYMRGRQYDQDFHLTVYEPVPRPQIRATVVSPIPGWCNLTMECNTTETREDLTVSWESEGLPRDLEQRPAPGPAPNPWTLVVNLPLSQPSPSLTCVVSNQGDKKTVTLDLGDLCDHGECTCQRGGTFLGSGKPGSGFSAFSPHIYITPAYLATPSRTLAGISNLRLPFGVSPCAALQPSPLLVQAAASRYLSPPSSITMSVSTVAFRKSELGISVVCAI
ncbi:SLAM family member 5-like isoform X1 [Mustela putorius furo]|uniref:SLAM family member 5-like isoform X1 n=1 Tax=Mustela putorius furo TaxID=9669 RepID=A0A8U0V9N7_MUSPF|nr:SLAM family member 5-like isoform X1 [Mustela putorius furo]